MPTRLRDWLLFPLRTPARAALAAAAVALLAFAGWHGLRVLRFRARARGSIGVTKASSE